LGYCLCKERTISYFENGKFSRKSCLRKILTLKQRTPSRMNSQLEIMPFWCVRNVWDTDEYGSNDSKPCLCDSQLIRPFKVDQTWEAMLKRNRKTCILELLQSSKLNCSESLFLQHLLNLYTKKFARCYFIQRTCLLFKYLGSVNFILLTIKHEIVSSCQNIQCIFTADGDFSSVDVVNDFSRNIG